jgi:hypothetical protein
MRSKKIGGIRFLSIGAYSVTISRRKDSPQYDISTKALAYTAAAIWACVAVSAIVLFA